MKKIEGYDESGNTEACKLAKYIKYMYNKLQSDNEISPIKLQKSLYFLFAYWGKFIKDMIINKSSIEEEVEKFPPEYEILFNDEIEAWTYGPVVREVFNCERLGLINVSTLKNDYLEDDKRKKDFIDNILKQLFEIDDFSLVKISHQDDCWKNNYIEADKVHNRVINKEDIINEYISK